MIGLGKIIHFSLILLLLTACSLPTDGVSRTTSEPALGMETALSIAAATAKIPRSTSTPAPLGTYENPLIIALPPGSSNNVERVEAGKGFAEQLSEVTGYTFVVVAPESYANLVNAIGQGNAHITVLTPYAYALAYEEGHAIAAFASLKSGKKAYGAQLIVRTESGFRSYFDTDKEENTEDAIVALSQFRDKKPCWPDETSPSGYVLPAGILAHNDISLKPGAILQGQPTVVRAVYVGGICDFGATYIDARDFPSILEEYPDTLEKVEIVWRIPPIIPYDVLVLSSYLSPEISKAIQDALFRITGMQAGRNVLEKAYEIEYWEPINDSFYEEFRLYLNASGTDLEELLDE